MRIAVRKETLDHERRVALVPDAAGRLVKAEHSVVVEAGAGKRAGFSDETFKEAGVEVAADLAAAVKGADVVFEVQPITESAVDTLPAEVALIGFLQPNTNLDLIQKLARAKVTSFSLELLPRISRAQSMDALSSQASVAGYKAVLVAAERLPKFFPMLMTAAGTIAPARVLVLGAGVAGLQAIATARRLGAVIEAYDVRPAVKEEVQSLGARFIELELEAQEGTGGYAREQSEEFLRRQRELIGSHVAASDVVITTAAIPGRKAPVLVTADMVEAMRPGSVVVDLAAETGGNVEGSKAGEELDVKGVALYGALNLPSTMPVHASQLYSKNVTSLLEHLAPEGVLKLDFEDEITKGTCVTHSGEVVHPMVKELLGVGAKT
ncbi:MAG TPA: Re/Si-specific NAD(P)(+) transhydrogenase subunit alpha [Solirubrobacterales bacterium]|nr:Re/Si-specific NAD(P)(+) transhydrogenase subunit alpha [Solirubrobacterales bacterium]